MTAPNAKPDRNACIVRDYTHGAMTMEQVARAYGITKQRVSQIIRAARLREQRERCARREHGRRVQGGYEAWVVGALVEKPCVRCADCGEVIE